ncbi:hypothetical protein TIFTF001_028389 [Ficus carica]|uniref:Uncharacterized protein n=1 Tax=Ficus carica TaxID=3494 RepID=A0AA88DPU7_FICCA|nr:hypothetical protein TIFTF001_028389 [Ficus carica]
MFIVLRGTGPSGSDGSLSVERRAEDVFVRELDSSSCCVCVRLSFTAGVFPGVDRGCIGVTGLSMANKWIVDPIHVPIGPVTRARTRRFKETLNGLIQIIWTEVNLCRPKGDVPRVPQGWISMIQALE